MKATAATDEVESLASVPLPGWNVRPRSARGEARLTRLESALGVAIVHALLAYALLTGLGVTRVVTSEESPLKLFDVTEPPPPPEFAAPPPERPKAERPQGAPAPPNLEARPREIAAPTPRIRLEVVQQLGAAPVASTGSDTSAGAAPKPGPGTGAGGAGTGLGSGGTGMGTGSGGGIATRARHLSGRIVDRDYPRSAYREQVGGVVQVRITVGTDGRVARCAVMRSSGNAELDDTTCRLIERRFRYEPARDRAGRAVVSDLGWVQRWWLEGR